MPSGALIVNQQGKLVSKGPSNETVKWNRIELAIQDDNTVTGQLLRQRMDVYQARKELLGKYADFLESIEAMSTGTGKVLHDIG